MGQDIQYNNVKFPGRAAASAACLGSHAARGDYRGCASAKSGSDWLVVAVVVREVQQLALRNSYYISAAPQILCIYMDAAPCAAGGLIIKVGRHREQ